MSKVFLILQDNEEARPIVEAIGIDNQDVSIDYQPGMVRIEAEGKLIVKRDTVSDQIGREWDVQELQVNLVSLSGHVDEDDDYFSLEWS